MPFKPRSFGEGEAPKEDRSVFQKMLDVISTPLYISAGITREIQDRNRGFLPTPISEIVKESAANVVPFLSETKRRTTFHDVIDSKGTAFALDIFGDPLVYVPGAAFTKTFKGVGAITKVGAIKPAGALIRGTDKVLKTDFAGGLQRTQDMLGRAFVRNYDIKRVGGEAILKLSNKHLMNLEKIPRELAENFQRKMLEKVDDVNELVKIYDLMEAQPIQIYKNIAGLSDDRLLKNVLEEAGKVSGLTDHPGFQQWFSEMSQLSPRSLSGWNFANTFRQELENIKIAAGAISTQQAAGMVQKFGIIHMPHLRGTRQSFIEVTDDFISRLKAKDPEALKIAQSYKLASGRTAKDAGEVIKDAQKFRAEVEAASEVLTPAQLTALKDSFSHTKPRKITGTAKEIVDNQMIALERDVSKALAIEGAEVGRFVASKKYVEELSKFIDEKGMKFSGDPAERTTQIMERFGVKGRGQFRGGFASLDDLNIAELRGYYVPKEIAVEIRTVVQAYKSPKAMRQFFDTYRKVQNVWKAWTLAIFPAYHSRNAISNLWNNFLAGMGPTATHHYANAMALMTKRAAGKLNKAEEKFMLEAMDDRAIRSGFFAGEIGGVMEKAAHPARWHEYIWSPAHNKAIQIGFKVGTFVEDHARLAHYMWARNGKGLSREAAQSSVNKYLFDYKYGLTPFEKKAFSDFLFPFYRWTRFNLPLQLEMLATRPGRFSLLPKGQRALQDVLGEDGWGVPDPQEMFMADWMKRALKVRLRWNEKTQAYEYFILNHWIPSADVSKVLGRKEISDLLLELTSPLTKVPIELLFNYNLFRKRKIREFPGEHKTLLGVKMAPELEHIARSVRLFNEADHFFKAFYKRTGETGKFEALTRFFVGKVYPHRPEQQKKWWVYRQNRYMGELKSIRRRETKFEDQKDVETLDKLIEEIEEERDYYKKL